MEREASALEPVAKVVHRLEFEDRAQVALLLVSILSAAGQPCQYLPGTDANLPMATAGFESVGYIDVMSERCDVVAAFFFPICCDPSAVVEHNVNVV